MQPIRKTIPKRTCSETYASYRSYKPFLQEDFNGRCGYCDDLDIHCGGKDVFHIEHFRPHSRPEFEHLKHDYNNLVYACPYCNRAKSNDWPAGDSEQTVVDGRGYVDPCDVDYENHLTRQDDGRILPQTAVGSYMFEHLKLGLRRHQLAWVYEQLEVLLRELTTELRNFDGNPNLPQKLSKHHLELTYEFLKYKSLFEETL